MIVTTKQRQATVQAKPSTKSQLPPAKVIVKSDLKNIVQVTEQNEAPCLQQQEKEERRSLKDKKNVSLWRRYVGCISFFCRFLKRNHLKIELDVNQSQFAQLIQKIRSRKKIQVVLPPQAIHKKVLVLDLDQTLIRTTFEKPPAYDFQTDVAFNGRNIATYTVKRFGLDSFLFQMSKLYQIVVFTASQRNYADKMIDAIDPKKRIAHRLYRQHCIIVNKTLYLKDLKALGRNMNQIIIVDDNRAAGYLQPENFYMIEPFVGNMKDRQLFRLAGFLKHLSTKKEVLPIYTERVRFQEMEIKLQPEQTEKPNSKFDHGRSLSQRQKQYRHKKKNSQIESLNQKEDQNQNQAQTTASQLVKKY